MSTITRERVAQFINNPLDNGLTRGEQMELARIALAAMDAEPVASCTVEDGQMCPDGFGECAHSLPDGTYELYTAPPAPVSVPDGLRLALSNAGISAPESDEMLAATCEKYIQELVAWVKDRKPFRSAVIPDGWVACSERMPEVGVKVLCFPVNDEPIHATYNGQLWLQDISWSTSDEPIDNVISCNVFHWMPLPAAPQQEA